MLIGICMQQIHRHILAASRATRKLSQKENKKSTTCKRTSTRVSRIYERSVLKYNGDLYNRHMFHEIHIR